MSKYSPLRARLAAADGAVEMTFHEIDELVGGLPDSARNYRAWWSNTHSHAQAWTATGRVVDQVHLTAERVRFSAPGGTSSSLASAIPDGAPDDQEPAPEADPIEWGQGLAHGRRHAQELPR